MLSSDWMLGRVLALPGDRLKFGEKTFTVNGETRPRPEGIPARGTRVVRAGELFVLPRLALDDQAAPGETIAKILADLAQVPETSVVGRPLPQWFGRPQVIP